MQATNKRNKKIISNLLKRIVIRKYSIFITGKMADMICTFICIDIPYSRWRKQQMKFIKDNGQSFIKQQTEFYGQQTNWLGKDRTKSTATSEGFRKTKEAVLQCKRHCFGRQKSLFCKSKLRTENKKTATSFWKLKSLGDKNGRYFEEKNTPIFFKKKERETENNCSDGVGEPQTKYGKNEMGE